ncbi:electron transport protein SCO1/SenC [Sulfuricurvum kujiense DSM 16994]|uniref:Electron transport protein SCO1/SenC n=1 Tax=Sulfuricurvum kujiense (strain ATCC BAA-921 / DSM 16994 / JCM 11577 / YK-1) TaxID=709032 RepID=E4U1A6_SULKY|nr:SCO family protein [Sulfuricurvum kujiense]ADR34443.1 electron transport protein SCO1/SenC [Sulfuricurvum kujiense DSM 16994]
MKKNIAGFILLFLMLSLLMIFPLTANFFTEETRSVKINQSDIFVPFLEHETTKAVFVYFGYVGCTAICIPTLNDFTPMYRRIHEHYPDTAFYFVNLNPTQPKEWVEPFAKSFDPTFHGIYATASEVDRFERNFHLALTPYNEEMSHSSNLYLLIREQNHYVLKRIYVTHPYSEDVIIDDLESLIV